MNAIARGFGARAMSFLPTALATLLANHLIITNYGVDSFNSYTLILSLINLLPLNNLGVGAAVTTALAEKQSDPTQVERTLLTASRVLALSSLGTAFVAVVLGLFGLWQPILGRASGPNLWIVLALVIFAVSFLPGLGQSVLLGANRNHVTIIVQTFFNPLNALLVGLVVVSGLTGDSLILIPSASLVVVNVVTAALATRASRLSWRRTLARLPRPRTFPGASIRAMSGPVLIITLATPIALQSDRIVLSHVSTADAVAQYSIALQIFAPALALLAATAQPLWPIWARARSSGQRGPSLTKVLTLFGLAGLVLGVALALLVGPAATLVGGSKVTVGPLLAVSGAALVITTSLAHPLAMSLMDRRGVRVILVCTLAALPLNIGASIVLAERFGAPGPLIASSVVGFAVQIVPAAVISRRRERARSALLASATGPVGASAADSAAPAARRPTPVPNAPAPGAATEPVRRAPRHAARDDDAAADALRPYRAFAPPAPEPAHASASAVSPSVRHRPRPLPGANGMSSRSFRAAAAYTAAASGTPEIASGTGVYARESGRPPAGSHDGGDVPDSAVLQPVAPFRRPSEKQSHRSHRER